MTTSREERRGGPTDQALLVRLDGLGIRFRKGHPLLEERGLDGTAAER